MRSFMERRIRSGPPRAIFTTTTGRPTPTPTRSSWLQTRRSRAAATPSPTTYGNGVRTRRNWRLPRVTCSTTPWVRTSTPPTTSSATVSARCGALITSSASTTGADQSPSPRANRSTAVTGDGADNYHRTLRHERRSTRTAVSLYLKRDPFYSSAKRNLKTEITNVTTIHTSTIIILTGLVKGDEFSKPT